MRPEAETESKTQESYILTKFSEGIPIAKGVRRLKSRRLKIERSEAEGTHTVDLEMIPKLRAVAPLRSQSGKYDKGSEQRSW